MFRTIPSHTISSRSIFLLAFLSLATVTFAADWTGFRGPGGLATSEETGLLTKWSETENLAWKTELPGLGTSSPITLGDSIYLTCYSGYGIQPNEGDQDDLKRHVVCLERSSGKIKWTKTFNPKLPESTYSGGNNSRHGYASSTPTTDGERLYVFFGKSGVYCLDLQGKELWHASVGEGTRGWGSSNSPVLYKNLLIVNASIESSSLVALDKMTGKQVWSVSGIRGCWNTPLLVDVPAGKTELVLSLPSRGEGGIVGFDPATGERLWRCEGIPDGGYVCPSVVAHEGIVYSIGGRRNTAIAVKAGGRGEVEPLWQTSKGSNVASPVFHQGHIYWAHEGRGAAYCLDAKTGKVVYEERLRPRPGLTYSSGTLADGKIYYVSQHAGTFVVAAKPEFELLAHNQFEDDARTNASPVVDNGRLLIRSDKFLYCVGKK